MYCLSVLFYWLIQQGVDATLNPSGPTVSVDCGGQQTFNCSVTGVSAGWIITGLDGIIEIRTSGDVLSSSNRVTTTDSSGVVQTSTITITGFSAADDGGTVQCVNQADSAVQGMATVSVATLASATAVMADVTQCPATLTWNEPNDSSATTSVSCTPSSPQCSSCNSSGCTIGGLPPSTSYTFTVTRNRSGCDAMTAMSSAVMSGGIPSCPTNVRVTDRSSDFSSATITWDQPTNSPPVTSYNVTCNSSCTVMPCTSASSTCRVLSVSPCEDYSVTVLPMNSCGSSICTGNTVPVPAQGIPDCGAIEASIDSCPTITFTPGTTVPSTVLVSFSNGPSSVPPQNCNYSAKSGIMCPMNDVVPIGNYDVRFTPQNSCGVPSSTCPTQNVMVSDNSCRVPITSPQFSTEGLSLTSAALGGIIAAGIIVILVAGFVIYLLVLLILARKCYSSIGFCGLLKCKCFNGKARRSRSKQRIGSASPVAPPAQPPAQPPADEYADPQAIRDRKERGKEDKDKIQYAAIDFSAGAGSGAGEVKIHQKEEPVIYTTVQHV